MDAMQKVVAARDALLHAALVPSSPASTADVCIAAAVASLADAVEILIAHSSIPREVPE